MSEKYQNSNPWFVRPFAAIWDFLGLVLNLVGRLLAGVLGIALMAGGIALTMTVIAAPIGIPFAIFGFLLMLRSVF